MSSLSIAVATYISYLIGSFSSAIIVCKIMGLPDPRREGSLNPGATNVLRIGGKKAAVITLLGDMLKGVIPVLVAKYLDMGTTGIALVAFAAFIGHLYPIFFRFEGGKGVATALGCMLALYWPVGLCTTGTWIIIAAISRYSSVASMISSLFAPVYMWYFTGDLTYTGTIALMSLILILRHISNIKNLMAGKERKLGKK